MPDKEHPALIEGCLQVGLISQPPHAEVGKVVQVLPKKILAIALVRPRVENVGMPEFIDWTRWADFLISVNYVESKKTAIQILNFVLVLRRPSLFFTKLPLEHAEVQARHLLKGRRDLPVIL